MEYIKIDDEQVSQKFKEWWSESFEGNVPVYNQADLDRFAELVKSTYNKQEIFNLSHLQDFLFEQIENGNLNRNQEEAIDRAIALFEFGANNMLKLF